MPIDPKKIARAAEIVASGEYAGEGYWRETARALLSEREELLARRDSFSSEVDTAARFIAGAVPDALAAALALLREVNDNWPQCPWCGSIRRDDPQYQERAESAKTIKEWLGVNREAAKAPPWPVEHAPDCRLAAFLKPVT